MCHHRMDVNECYTIHVWIAGSQMSVNGRLFRRSKVYTTIQKKWLFYLASQEYITGIDYIFKKQYIHRKPLFKRL